MSPKFNPGDIITIKSGGPKMTVYTSTNEGWTYCYFYSEEEKKIKEGIKLPTSVLTLAT